MSDNNNREKTEEEIENDFNEDISKMDKQNYDIENELTDYIPYTLTNSKRDNETSGISLLKELEDKWENIEKNKQKPIKLQKKKEKHNNGMKRAYIKSLVEESKQKFMKKIQTMRMTYNASFEEFESYASNAILKMENIKIQNDQIRSQLEAYDNATNKPIEDNNKEDIPSKEQKKERTNTKKSFLKQDDTIPQSQNTIPLAYRGNLFTCKEMTSIEGLVYETPSTTEGRKEIIQKNFTISDSLANKMKSVYEDITAPSQPILNSTTNIEDNDKQDENNDTNNIKINFNTGNSLYTLEKQFDEIITKIKPNLNGKISGAIIKKDIDIKKEDDEYFESLAKEAGYKKGKSNSNLSENNQYNFSNYFTDKKFSKKIEENVKLLNNVMSGEIVYKKKLMNNDIQNKNGMLNASYLRNHSISLLNNTNSVVQDNKIYSKNKFDDTISKIYQANATKIQKLINGKS